jgi:hypothetical protein
MAKRKTIGENPLDAVVPRAPSRAPAAVAEARELPRPTKERMTFHLPVEVWRTWLPRPSPRPWTSWRGSAGSCSRHGRRNSRAGGP